VNNARQAGIAISKCRLSLGWPKPSYTAGTLKRITGGDKKNVYTGKPSGRTLHYQPFNNKENNMERKIDVGDILIHRQVLSKISGMALTQMLGRHRDCDWGDIGPGEKLNNDDAAKNNDRIVSGYLYDGELCMIVTEGDRRLTLIILLADYNRVYGSFLELKNSQKQD
jgi:hypothetical protein